MTARQSAVLRPMRESDVAPAALVSLAAFGAATDDAATLTLWGRRVGHCLATDPHGAFVAERDGRLVGVVAAIRREGTWILSLLSVDPASQGGGVGRLLLSASLDYAAPDDAGLIISSNDSRALGAYGGAGFALIPAFEARGTITLARRPDGLPEVSDGTGDLAALSAISRAVRGASHELELPNAVDRGARVLRLDDRGFAVVLEGNGVWMLAARDEAAATALLWHALAEVGQAERGVVRWMTGAQQWAIGVALRAGLRLVPYGAICVRRVRAPLRPYLPSASFA